MSESEDELDLKQMRQFSSKLASVIDVQKEILTDLISNWPEDEVIAALQLLNKVSESDDPERHMAGFTPANYRQMASLASLALQVIVKAICDKNIFLEETE